MTRDDWLKAAQAHSEAADTLLRIFEREAAAREMVRSLDALAEADRLVADEPS